MAKLFPFRVESPNAKVRLLTLPFVGGGANVFKLWSSKLPPWIEVAAFELAGRGTRMDETPLRDMNALVSQIEQALGELRPLPLAIFGHSMGARVGFQLAKQWERSKRPRVEHFFASASRPPQLEVTDLRANLPRAAFRKRLRDMGGTPEEVLADEEMMEMVEPLLRADFTLFEGNNDSSPIETPLTAFLGKRDIEVPPEEAVRWKEATTSAFRLVELDGTHFFITEDRHRTIVWDVIAESLKNFA